MQTDKQYIGGNEMSQRMEGVIRGKKGTIKRKNDLMEGRKRKRTQPSAWPIINA